MEPCALVGMLFSQSTIPKELHSLAMEAALGVFYHLLCPHGISVCPSHTVSLDFIISIAWTHCPLSHVPVTAEIPAPIPVPVLSASLILASLTSYIP